MVSRANLSKLVLVLGLLAVFSQLVFASDAIVAYRSDSSSCSGGADTECPKVRFWNSSGTGTWGSEINLSDTGSDVEGLVVKWSPISNKIVMVTVGSDGNLDGFVCMSNCGVASSWNFTSNIGTVPDPDVDSSETNFDLAFETSSGDAILVYGIESSNSSRDLGFKVLPAASSSWSGVSEQYVNDTSGGTDNVQYLWAKLDRDPVASSQELALVGFETTNDDINAWIWSGSSFTNQIEISSSATDTADKGALAVQYSSDGSIAMALGANGTNGNVNFRRWNGTNWSAVSAFDSSGTGTDSPFWISLKEDPSSDDLMAVIVADDSDMHTAYWNGSTWNTTDHIDDDVDDFVSVLFPADVDWNPTGSTGRLVWDTDGSGSTLSTRLCNPKCNGTTTNISAYTLKGQWLSLYRNPTASDAVDILGIRLSDDLDGDENLGSFRWNGTNFTNYGDAVISTDVDQVKFRVYSLDFSPVAGISTLKLNQTAQQPSPGGVVQFNITVNNTGNTTLSPVRVVDLLPVGLTFSSASVAPSSVVGQTVTWNNVGPLSPGSAAVIYLNATVNSGVVNATNQVQSLTNCVNATGASNFTSNVTAAGCANATVFYSNVSVVKVDMTSAQPSPGGLVQYNLTVTNTGNVTLNTVQVMDDLPSELSFVSAFPAETSEVGGLVTWANVGPLASGASTVIYVNASVNPGVVNASVPVLNVLNCVNTTGVPPNGFNVTDSDCANTAIYYASVSAVKLDMTAAQPSPGGLVQYNLTVTNTGNVTLSPVQVVDDLPAELTFVSASPSETSESGGIITWATVGPLAPGASTVLYVNASVNPGVVNASVPVLNVANCVNTTGTPPNGFDVTDSDCAGTDIYYAAISTVKLDMTGAQPSPGGLVQFNITVTNTGNVTLNPVEVEDDFPTELTLVSTSPAYDDFDGFELDWFNVGPLAPGASTVIYINATVNTGVVDSGTPQLSIMNCGESVGTPPNGDDVFSDESCVNVTIYYANVSVVKVDMTPLPPSQGGMVQWQVNVSNPGEVSLSPVRVTDVLPAGLTFSSASVAPDSVVGQVVTWNNLGPIAPGGSVLLLVNSTVNLNTTNGTYCNTVNATGMPPNGFNVSNDDQACVSTFSAAVNAVKTASPTSVLVGQNVSFSVNITNTGGVNLTVSVVDTLPTNVGFEGSVVAPTSVVSGTVTWSGLTTIVPGSSYVLLYDVSANQSGNYSNNVVVTGVPPNGVNVTDSDMAFFIVTNPPGDDDDDDDDDDSMSISVSTSCDNNVVTVTDGGPVSGALVKVDGDTVGTTDSNGQVSFTGCGREVTVRASKSGYQDEVDNVELASCDCGPVCQEDADCGSAEQCSDENQCVPIDCGPCQSAQNHQCKSLCGSGQSCVGNQCKDNPECTSDMQCADDQFCNIPPQQNGGSCQDLCPDGSNFCQCSNAVGHNLVPTGWECGTELGCSACPTGQQCIAHKCVGSDLSCPTTGTVGENKTCSAVECADCDIQVTGPDGKKSSGRTDQDGNFDLPLNLEGTYMVVLYKDGQPVKTVEIKAFPQSPPEAPDKPTATGDQGNLIWLLILMLLVILGVVYWRRRTDKSGKK